MPDNAIPLDISTWRRLPVLPLQSASLVATPAGQRQYEALTEWLNQQPHDLANAELHARAVAAGLVSAHSAVEQVTSITVPHSVIANPSPT